jgi:hypothetical protein
MGHVGASPTRRAPRATLPARGREGNRRRGRSSEKLTPAATRLGDPQRRCRLIPPLYGEGGPAKRGRVGFTPHHRRIGSNPTRRAARDTLPARGREGIITRRQRPETARDQAASPPSPIRGGWPREAGSGGVQAASPSYRLEPHPSRSARHPPRKGEGRDRHAGAPTRHEPLPRKLSTTGPQASGERNRKCPSSPTGASSRSSTRPPCARNASIMRCDSSGLK